MKHVYLAALVLFSFMAPAGAVTLSKNGAARTVIIVDPDASAPEQFAARQLAGDLKQITGATFEIQTNTVAPRHAIIVGQGKAAQSAFRDVKFAQLGNEEWVIRTKGERLLLGGGRPRGTLYAVSEFLQGQCGVRWWTPWASAIPKKPTLKLARLKIQATPAFEYRCPFWYDAFNPAWSWENLCNSEFSHLTAEQGGSIDYEGFVHTFYHLVPPDKYFSEHPEWYSLIDGKRTASGAQLCTTDPSLRDFMVKRVLNRLRKSPGASIISVSQNDCFHPCECSNCAAIDKEEGSHSGTMIDLVNYIAERIAPEFPNVAVDTLAYQYTRKPPLHVHPRTNVIVRLCSIECNFRQPLGSAANASFGDDIRGWSKIANRLYIWDYVTDFGNYDMPFPNWFELGPNLRFFQTNHVLGVFEEGAYQSHGSEMAEMRAWVLAQLMRDPHQDDRALIREFCDGYYGPAGKPIYKYLELVSTAAKDYDLTCGASRKAEFLDFKTLSAAEQLWQQAEQAVAGDKELLTRVRLGHLPVRYVWLYRWNALQKQCAKAHGTWPLHESRHKVAQEWRAVADGVPDKPWTKVTVMSEGGWTPASFLSEVDPAPSAR